MIDTNTIQSEPTPDVDAIDRVKRLARQLSREIGIPHQKTLDGIARMAGMSHWGAYAAKSPVKDQPPFTGPTVLPGDRRPLFAGAALIPGSDVIEPIRAAIDQGRSLAVVGSTSTGKSTLLSRILVDVDQTARIHYVDTPDLKANRRGGRCDWHFHDIVRWPNGMEDSERRDYYCRSLVSAMSDALMAEPDAIVIGEFDTINGLSALTSGRRFMTTVHGEDVDVAIEVMARKALDALPRAAVEERLELYMEMAARKFCFVQVTRDLSTGIRSIGEIRI